MKILFSHSFKDKLIKSVWKCIPHERKIDEGAIRARLDPSSSQLSEKHVSDSEETPAIYEIRDEAGRKWWKIFDEFEFRLQDNSNKNRKWYHWFEPTDTPTERKLLFKLDLILCFFAFTMYWVKYLDQTNLNNAYVSGMKEDLGMKGNDLVNTQSIYTVGAIVFHLPFMYLIHKYPTNYLLPAMDVGWGLFTLAIFKAKNTSQLQVFRFFVGAFESAFYPTINYILGSWYTPSEYARRAGIFYWGQMLGVLTAGLLQAAAFKNLHLVNGLEGWRWMFIIDAIITFPIGIIGIWALPGIPAKCYSVFLTDEEIYLGRERLRRLKINVEDDSNTFFTLKLWKDMLSKWNFWLFTLVNVFSWNNSSASSGSYILWLKSLERFSTVKVNQLSTLSPALGILWILLTSSIADLLRSRWGAIIFSQTLNVIGNVILAIWDVPESAKWFAFMLQYFGQPVFPVNFGWMGDSMRDHPQQRAIITMSMNMWGQVSTAWISLLVWKTVEAPRYLKGYIFTTCCAFMVMVICTIILILYKRDERARAAENGIYLYNSAKGEPRPVILSSAKNGNEVLVVHNHDDAEKKEEFVVVRERNREGGK